MRYLAPLGAAAAALLAAAPSTAKPKPPQIATQLAPGTVDVGQIFHVTLHVQGEEPRVSSPAITAPTGVELLGGPNLTHKTFATWDSQHRLKTSTQVDVTWQFIAHAVGHYTIHPPTAVVNGKRVTGNVTNVEVVASTGAPKGSQGPLTFPQLPGMPKINIPGWPFGTNEPDDEPPPSARPELDLAKAPDPLAFARIVPDKTEAVVGEQVTVAYYLYCRFNCEYREPADPSFPDFKRLPLDKNRGAEPSGSANVGGQRFATQLLGRMAVFPLRAGDLGLGAMTVQVTGKRFGRTLEPRTSDTVAVHVTDPPTAGRPPGYALGDVGQFSISAAVQPRKIDLGGSVAVTLKIAGTGFPPEALRVPSRKGVDWLDPEKKESIEVQAGKIAGTRTFGYVVKLANSGEQDLGTVELPYWDPVAKKYATASAALGTIEVSGVLPPPDPGAPAAGSGSDDALGSLPSARKELAPFTLPDESRALAGKRFWALLAAPPLGVVLFTAGAGAARAIRRRRQVGAASPRATAERALNQARASLDGGAHVDAAAGVERACHAAIEASWGLRSRGVLLAELPAELERRGAAAPLAARLGELLGACDELRFVPATERSARDLVEKANALVPEVLKVAPRP